MSSLVVSQSIQSHHEAGNRSRSFNGSMCCTHSCQALLCLDPAAGLPGLPPTQLPSSQSTSSAGCLGAPMLASAAAERQAAAVLKGLLATAGRRPGPGLWLGRSWRCGGQKRRARIGTMSGRQGSSECCAGARPLIAVGAPGEELHGMGWAREKGFCGFCSVRDLKSSTALDGECREAIHLFFLPWCFRTRLQWVALGSIVAGPFRYSGSVWGHGGKAREAFDIDAGMERILLGR